MKAHYEIPNPKELITDIMPKVNSLQTSVAATLFDTLLGLWEGSYNDVNQVVSLPIFMFSQAVQTMQTVKDVGENIAEKEAQHLILTILSAILFFIPFIGELVAIATGLRIIARVAATIGAVGDGSLAAAEIFKNPESAPMLILGMFAPGNIRGPKQFEEMANARRKMSPDDVLKMGPEIKRQDDLVQSIIKSCTKK